MFNVGYALLKLSLRILKASGQSSAKGICMDAAGDVGLPFRADGRW